MQARAWPHHSVLGQRPDEVAIAAPPTPPPSDSSPPTGPPLNARDFGAVGDGRADDTTALQSAIDAAQSQGKQLYVPGGSYGLSKPLIVHCVNKFCSPQGPSLHRLHHNFSGLSMSGAGMYATHLFAIASAPRLESILHFESHAVGNWAKGTPNAQPDYNVTDSHQVTDLHLGGGATRGWQRDMGWTVERHANYGVWGPGLTRTLFARLQISRMGIASARLYYCWYNRFLDCDIHDAPIGIHSACNNMRISGTNIDSMDITGILIDGGAATDIVGNLIEGNAGPAIISNAGWWGAPQGLTIDSNYYEANNNNPIHFKSFTGDRPGHPDTTLCTDLLLNGFPWNQSFISVKPTPWDSGYNNCFGNIEGNCSIVGQLGSDFPTWGVTYTGNTHDPPGVKAASSCTTYAAITAVAVVGLTASGNTVTDCLPSMAPAKAVLLRTGTDSAQWLATDINLIGNAAIPAYGNPRENYGWSGLIELMHGERSLSASEAGFRGEVPLHTFFSPELTQRNFYWGSEPWVSLDQPTQKLTLTQQPHGGYDGLESVLWESDSSSQHESDSSSSHGSTTTSTALIARFDLSEMPSLAGQAVYLALRWKPLVSNSSVLSLLIDTGSGDWQQSNATGLVCNSRIVAGCQTASGTAVPALAGQWRLRVYAATMAATGTARFALRLTVPSSSAPVGTKISGIVIAPIGARYQNIAGLKTDDGARLARGGVTHRRFADKNSWKQAMNWRTQPAVDSSSVVNSVAPPSSTEDRLNARDFGAVGDGHADDTAALQSAIDAAQSQGKQLYVPGGSYGLSKPLFVHCCNEWCAPGFSRNTTHFGLFMSGAGEFLTHLFARADAPRLKSILLFESHNTSKGPPAQPQYNTSINNQISDIHLSGGATQGWERLNIPEWCGGSGPDSDPSRCGADYGIYGGGLTWSLFQRISVTFTRLAGFRAFYCWYNRIEDSNFRQSQIGVHSACNNMRISGTNIDMQDITGILIDGGASIDIVGNLIEGNAGPGITLSAGIWGAPTGITVQSNYYEANNLYPIYLKTFDGPMVVCTDLLLLGMPWNQSYVRQNSGPNLANLTIDSTMVSNFPIRDVSYVGNTHDPPSQAAAPACTSYAAITAGSVLGLTATSNSMTVVRPSMGSLNGVLLRMGTDSASWFAADINLIGNPVVPAYRQNAENYGWWPLVSLHNSNRSLHSPTDPRGCRGCRGELPFHTVFSPEVPQRNFYRPSRPCCRIVSCGGIHSTIVHNQDGYDGLEAFSWTGPSAGDDGSTIQLANFSLADMPSLAGTAVYLAVYWRPTVNGSSLSLLIDTGSGVWQESNATGLNCNVNLEEDCAIDRLPPAAGVWRPRVFGATLALKGRARFALRAFAPAAGSILVSGIVIAPIGARYSTVAQ